MNKTTLKYAAVSLGVLGIGAGALIMSPLVESAEEPVIAAAGDIACKSTHSDFNRGAGVADNCRAAYTANVIDHISPDAVLALGDQQYEQGTLSEHNTSYEQTWGRFKSITYPTPGNHEYFTPDASGYFDYFNGVGAQTGRAGNRGEGWYSFDIGDWHIISLNSECQIIGCDENSAQFQWLEQDLTNNNQFCTLAFWHKPRFSTGPNGSALLMADIWNELAVQEADVVLAGHNHLYERFAPAGVTPVNGDPYQGPVLDSDGIRSFVVGTGGKELYDFTHEPLNGEAVRQNHTFGVLKMTLKSTSYEWEFVPAAGRSFQEPGSGQCH